MLYLIDEAIQDSQSTFEELKTLQAMRGKIVELDSVENKKDPDPYEDKQQESLSAPVSSAVPAPTQDVQRYTYQVPSAPRSQPHIVTSSVVGTAKLIKLKGELLNLLFIFPEKSLRWPDQDAASETSINAAGETAAAQVHASAAKYVSSGLLPPPSIDLSPENVERLAERAARKAKRRLRRKLAAENFISAVQKASTPQQLMTQILLLENIVPPQFLFRMPRYVLPSEAHSCAALAIRIFFFDRCIAYHELIGVENAGVACPLKLRFQFAPRCHLSPFCTRFLGHSGKCLPASQGFSRLPDHFHLAPPQDGFSKPTSLREVTYNGNQTVRPAQAVPSTTFQQQAPPRIAPKANEVLPTLAALITRANCDIELVTPYVPAFQELVVTEWL